MSASQPSEFDFDKHEHKVNKFFEDEARRRARVTAFDYLVDMALDGVIEMSEALQQYRAELEAEIIYGEQVADA